MGESSKTEAIVEFDYVARQSDELTLRKGDIITEIKTQPGGWWEGCLGGKRGMFPDNFVRVLTEPFNKKDSLTDGVTLRGSSNRRCKVLFSYKPANDDELALQVNDIIDILGEVEEGWWKGKLRDVIGVFPSNFVMELKEPATEENHSSGTLTSNQKSRSSSREDASESDGELSTSVSSPDSSQLLDSVGKCDQDPDAPLLPPKPVKELCRALFPYEAANDDELTLKEGDLITLLSKEVADKGWWRGELRGRVGVFPDNFVEVILQDEQPKKPERPPVKSQMATTNRIRDTITKPATPALSKSESVDTLRKSSDASIRSDDRMSTSVPPIPGKKPQLPPPIKKPQRMGLVGSLQHQSKSYDSMEQRLTDTVDGAGRSRMSRSYNVVRSSKDEVPEFDSVERNAMLIHPTASRAKAPRRRLPTTIYNRETEVSSGMMNGSADSSHNDLENHHDEVEEKEDVGPRGRLWEKNKAPWVEELKLNQAKKTVPGSRSSLSPRSPTPLQPSPSTASRSPEQGDKKSTPPAKENKPQPEQGQTRFSNAQTSAASPPPPLVSNEPAIPLQSEATSRQTSSSVTLRHLASSRTQSLYEAEGVRGSQSRPFSMSPSPSLGAEQPRLPSETSRTPPGLKPVPGSQTNRSTSPLPSAAYPTNVPSSVKPKTHSPSLTTEQDVLSLAGSTFPSPGSTVPQKQYLELKEKVLKLEQSLEQQKHFFTQALKDLTDKLNDEVSRRIQIEQNLDKLTNLVTQV